MFTKNIQSILVLVMLAIAFYSCEEVGPAVNLEPKPAEEYFQSETIESKQGRRVFLEEFTGVDCSNCPRGHQQVANYESMLGAQFAAAAMHPEGNELTWIDDRSILDLTNEKAFQIHQQFGGRGLPCATIDRVLFANEDNLLLLSQSWGARVEERLSVPTGCNIDLEANYFENSDSLAITATIHYTEPSIDNHYITIGLTEDGIIEPQKQPDISYIDDYQHNHVLRKILTGFNGDLIIGLDEPKIPGLTVIRRYSLTNIPESWNKEDLSIYALLHGRGETKDVLQSAEMHWPN